MLNVIKSEAEVKKARMALYESARQVLNNGMRVLGLSPVERYVLFFFRVLYSCLGCVANWVSFSFFDRM